MALNLPAFLQQGPQQVFSAVWPYLLLGCQLSHHTLCDVTQAARIVVQQYNSWAQAWNRVAGVSIRFVFSRKLTVGIT